MGNFLRHSWRWAVLLTLFLLALRMKPEAAWLPGLPLALQLVTTALSYQENAKKSWAALQRVHACFLQSGEPDLVAIFGALDGAEELAGARAVVEWSERYQRGMVTRQAYYAGVRSILARHGFAV